VHPTTSQRTSSSGYVISALSLDLQGANAALAKGPEMQPQRPEDVKLETVWSDENDA